MNAWIGIGSGEARRDTVACAVYLAAVLVAGAAGGVDLAREWESQHAQLQRDLAQRAFFAKVAPETYRPDALILAADRDPADIVLRRTAALFEDLRRGPAGVALEPLSTRLSELRKLGADLAVTNAAGRKDLYLEACKLRREIAFKNPLLNIERLVFLKRHRALMNHMCDQFYGMAQRPGGGVFVLDRPFGSAPAERDLLAASVVQNGRLQGQRLSGGPGGPYNLRFDGMGNLSGDETTGGSFLSPDISYDGRSIAFAYVECTGDRLHRHHTDASRGHWAEGRSYHVFSVRDDGSNLTMLTDGTWNDMDPCWLPNGRIAFISERRGGYLRCGRACPLYNLYDMAADGSGINCLSFHDSNEWQPAVTHDGRIVYTRWDYVDRYGCIAHMPWITTLAGTDSRAMHGNYAIRAVRPDMELDVQPIPGSPKFVATAAPHHGQAFGSLVIVDPRVADDDGMGPVRRLTPEVGFPESQGGTETYGTAWPLSEDYHLCAYDPAMDHARGGRGDYGLYLVDSFGNKELVWRDPDIGCMSPLPLAARRMPPVPASPGYDAATAPDKAVGPGAGGEGTMAVMNVYDSLKPMPEGTKITSLRVLQVLPMSVPSGPRPHDTGKRIAGAGDSVVPCRWIVGTVPVEADGSAHFTVPAHRMLFFQALDERGLAVQSMRSETYVREGERLTCVGCHNPWPMAPGRAGGGTAAAAPGTGRTMPIAMRRAPSKPVPDVDGTWPFSYPRLVQPVLDRNCVECHDRNPGKAPNLHKDPVKNNWYASYAALVDRGFTDYQDGYRTTPGRFGARASPLFAMLEKGHHDVKLGAEDWHRLMLWVDCCSMFYGVFEKEGGEVQLAGGVPKPTLE